ncbi:MAG: LLM class flavin-dependent oxidoreductase, partial [Mycetocola sp.]
MTLTLGYKASAEQFAPRELVELAVAAEAHGFESVAVSDHFQPWRHEGGHAPFSLAWMAAVGERTSTIRIGTSVMTPTFRYNPAVIAQAFATLGCLYPGRIMLGVGSGEALNEIATGFRGAGEQTWPEFRERFARLRESIRLMRELWSGDRVTFEGEY